MNKIEARYQQAIAEYQEYAALCTTVDGVAKSLGSDGPTVLATADRRWPHTDRAEQAEMALAYMKRYGEIVQSGRLALGPEVVGIKAADVRLAIGEKIVEGVT